MDGKETAAKEGAATASAADQIARRRAAAPEAHRTLAFASVAIALTSNDVAAADWLVEFLEPWFARTGRTAEWRVRVTSSGKGYAEQSDRRPRDSLPLPCFALDQQVISLPAWSTGGGVTVADEERSCFFSLSPCAVDLIADPSTRRWRFTLMWLFHEIATTHLRRTQLDIHAAAVEADGRGLLIVGPKGAGKTTLCCHLLRSGQCRLIANDRAFAGGMTPPFMVRGVPTAVKLRPFTVAEFPELRRGLPCVERPYLHTLEDLARTVSREEPPESAELALSPAQLAHQMRVQSLGSAPLGAIVFPRIRADVDGWAVERLEVEEVRTSIWENLYGGQSGGRAPTLFEDLDGGPSVPSRRLADAMATGAPAYRVDLGRRAYGSPELAARLLQILVAS